MTFDNILQKFRQESFTEREKGGKFERLMQHWLKSDGAYSSAIKDIWLWNEFPGRKDLGGKDLGIDLVAKTDQGEYWAIQCKCYDEHTVIDKSAVDSFISTAHRQFSGADYAAASFSRLIWISTSSHWGGNALETLKGQDIPVTVISMQYLRDSAVNWDALFEGKEGDAAQATKKQPREHQRMAMEKAREYYKDEFNNCTCTRRL